MKVRHVEDYYDKIKEKFPHLEMWEIEKILYHGFQSLFTLNSFGADVCIRSDNFTMYFGKLFNKKDLWWKYYYIKWKIKLRINYLSKKLVWDGNYYFGLTNDEYNTLIPKKSGRYKNKITFPTMRAFKIKEEAYLNPTIKYLFRLTGEKDKGLTFYEKNYSTRNIELIAVRDKDNKMKYNG